MPKAKTDEGYTFTAMEKRNVKLKRNSQALRRNMTKQEKKLWYEFLKDLPKQVYRQKILGNFIVDFYCPCEKIVIELDGSQHYDGKTEQSDLIRDRVLAEAGITVLRYSNLEVSQNFDGVCQDIYNKLKIE